MSCHVNLLKRGRCIATDVKCHGCGYWRKEERKKYIIADPPPNTREQKKIKVNTCIHIKNGKYLIDKSGKCTECNKQVLK